MERILEGCELRLGAAGAAAGTSTVDGAVCDMQDFDGVLIFATIATANAGNFLKAQQGEASNLSDAADLAGTKVIAAANGQVVALDLMKPKERYVRGNIVRGVSTATGDLYYVRYHDSNKPSVNQVANTLISVALNSPAEGTP
jgi:hypothetical protein